MSSTIPAPTIDPAAHGLRDGDLDNLRHMAGMCRHRRRGVWGYRNHFAAGGDSVASMERLRAAGLVQRGAPYRDAHFYHATTVGCAAIGMSPAATRRAMGDD